MMPSALLALLIAQSSAVVPPADPPHGYRDQAQTIMADDPASLQTEQEWGYSEAIAAGNTVYVSGVVAGLRPDERGLEPAFTRAFDEIARRLARLDCNWGDVVEITSFHTDLVSQMPAVVAVKRRYVRSPFPAWTAVGVTRLIPASGLAEIRVTAIRRSSPRNR